jgi:hypothetical protein
VRIPSARPPLDRVKGPPVGWRSTAIELRRLPYIWMGFFSFRFETLDDVISCFLPWIFVTGEGKKSGKRIN